MGKLLEIYREIGCIFTAILVCGALFLALILFAVFASLVEAFPFLFNVMLVGTALVLGFRLLLTHWFYREK